MGGFIKKVDERNLTVDAVMAIKDGTILGLHRFSDNIYHNVFSVAKPQWDTDLSGHTFAASDLYLDIVDLAKLGELYAGYGFISGAIRGQRFYHNYRR